MTINLLLKCEDPAATRAFYSRILGFDVSDSANGTCTVRKWGGTIIFTGENLWDGRPHCSGTIYFFVPDVDEYYNAIKDRVAVQWQPQNMSYGTREFAVTDCNGYLLAFAQRS